MAEDKELREEQERKEVLEKLEARRERRVVGRTPAGLGPGCKGRDRNLGGNAGLEQRGAEGGRERRKRQREERKKVSEESVQQKEMERVEVKVEKLSDGKVKCEVKVNAKEVERRMKERSVAHLRGLEVKVERVESVPALAPEPHPPGRRRLLSSRSAVMEEVPGEANSTFITTLPRFEEAHGAKDARAGKKPVRKVKKAKTTIYLWGAVRR